MKEIKQSCKSIGRAINSAIAVLLCLALISSVDPVAFATEQSQAPAAATIPNDQLDSLVAPIALYPDPLLSQILVASTYPLEIVQLGQWIQKNSKMPPDKMAEAVKKEDWDPSVQGLVALPDVVKNLSENIKWTTDLGNAFLAQQKDVMDAVQRMRAKAKQSGNLKTTEQQKVETKVVETKEVIVIQPAKTEVIYVPSYNPTVVYGPPVYPYPPYPYPPPPPPGAYVAGMAVAFGVGMMVGAAWHGGYGYGCGWGHNDVTVNVNNNYNKQNNVNNVNNVNKANSVNKAGGGSNSWQHNPQHRAGTPYPNQNTAKQYGGTARGDSMSTRQANARQNQSQAAARQQTGGSNRSNTGAQAGNRQNQSQSGGRQQAGVSNNANAGAQAGNRQNQSQTGGRQQAGVSNNANAGAQGGNRETSASTANRSSGGKQSVSSGSGSGGNSSAFGGSGGSSRSSATASSSRGTSSMSGSRSGGSSRSSGGGRR